MLSTSVPWAGPFTNTAVSPFPSASVSLARTEVPANGVSSAVEKASFTATGASLTGVTEIETVAGAEVKLPSFAVKVKESGP